MADYEDKPVLTHSDISKIPEKQTAIALKEGIKDGHLPSIAATGQGKIAEQILKIAYEKGIKVRKDTALAEMLYSFDIDSPIPSEAFTAIAEILSYLYRANGENAPFDAVLNYMQILDEQSTEEEDE